MIDFGFFLLVIACVIGGTYFITLRFFAPNPCDECEIKDRFKHYWDEDEEEEETYQ